MMYCILAIPLMVQDLVAALKHRLVLVMRHKMIDVTKRQNMEDLISD